MSEEKYSLLFDFGIKMLSIFGTTYICERGFSDMSYVKSKYTSRSKLDQASLKNCLRLATTAIEVDIPTFVNAKQAHPSHKFKNYYPELMMWFTSHTLRFHGARMMPNC